MSMGSLTLTDAHHWSPQVRENGHVPCPDAYMLTMISDFSRQLGPTSMSAWIAGAGWVLVDGVGTVEHCWWESFVWWDTGLCPCPC